MRLRELYDRLEQCNTRYWDIPKDKRIDDGLREEVGSPGYSGARVIDGCRNLLSHASIGRYPFRSEEIASFFVPELRQEFQSLTQVVQTLDRLIQELETKLTASETRRT